MARGIEVLSKLVPKSIGNPKMVTAKPDTDNTPHILGVIMGRATKLAMRTMPDSSIFWALAGEFRGVPADETKNMVQSGLLYLPSGIFEMIGDKLRDAKTGEDTGVIVDFAFEVSTVKASNPAGYSWSFRPLIEVETVDDPLSEIMKACGIEAPVVLPAAAPAPALTDETKKSGKK